MTILGLTEDMIKKMGGYVGPVRRIRKVPVALNDIWIEEGII